MAGGVGSVGSSDSAQDIAKDLNKAETKQEGLKADRANLEAAMDRQAKGPDSSSMQAFIAQIQAQQAQQSQNQQPSGGSSDDLSPAQASKAAAVGKAVYNQILSMMPSQQTIGASSGAPAGGDDSGGSAEGKGGMGAATAKMGAEDEADKNIQSAAKASVYNDIYHLLNKMQDVRSTKASLQEKITSIDQAMAGHKPGDKIKVPVWEYDQASGQVKFKGYKEMSYEDAGVMKQKLGDSKDALSEMSQDDMFWMQRFMEQKSQLEQMISNVMKAASEAQSGIAGNLKAS